MGEFYFNFTAWHQQWCDKKKVETDTWCKFSAYIHTFFIVSIDSSSYAFTSHTQLFYWEVFDLSAAAAEDILQIGLLRWTRINFQWKYWMLNCSQIFTINSNIQFFSVTSTWNAQNTWHMYSAEQKEEDRGKLPGALWVLLTGLTSTKRRKFKEMCLFFADNIYFFVNFNIILRNMNFYNPFNRRQEENLRCHRFSSVTGVKIRRLFAFHIKLLVLTWFLCASDVK